MLCGCSHSKHLHKVPWGQSVNDSSQVAQEKGSVGGEGQRRGGKHSAAAAPDINASVFHLLEKKNPSIRFPPSSPHPWTPRFDTSSSTLERKRKNTPECCCFFLPGNRSGAVCCFQERERRPWAACLPPLQPGSEFCPSIRREPKVPRERVGLRDAPKCHKGLSGLPALASPLAALQMTLFVCLQRHPGRRRRS